MIRKVKVVLMLLTIMLLSELFLAPAVKALTSDLYEYFISNNAVEITAYLGNQSKVIVPESIDGYPVEVIGQEVFSQRQRLTSIALPEGLQSISDETFSYCPSLTSITLPETLKEIGNMTFAYCDNLTYIYLPESLNSIGDNPFIHSPTQISLSPVHPRFAVVEGVLFDKEEKRLITYPYGNQKPAYSIPVGTLTIGLGAFGYCELTSVTLPPELLRIGQGAFAYCDSLPSVTLPKKITYIGDNAFSRSIGESPIPIIVYPGSYAEAWAKENGVPFVNADSTFQENINLTQMEQILNMTVQEAVDWLEGDYTEEGTGGEGSLDGYFFPDKKITLSFEGHPPFSPVIAVYCWKGLNLAGVEVGMSIRSIKEVLGEPAKTHPADDISPAVYIYHIGNLQIDFISNNDDADDPTSYAIVDLWH